jgi:hypothetical protein
VNVVPTITPSPEASSTPVLTIRRPMGTPIRLTVEPLQSTPVASLQPLPTDYTNPAIEAAKVDLGVRLNIAPETIELVSIEEVEWPDGCLGVVQPDLMCIQVITPGYRIILQVDGQQYEYHTNSAGTLVILVP